ncbi:DUF2290 domain-containing protein [Bradyrhizobium sp. BR 1433]|uniref:DUF2290 domain-containing protein n=1 Tax=Bradyrhizobium sp. BR 1433 TaxID=3447967 RepID=UPI003EE674FD
MDDRDFDREINGAWSLLRDTLKIGRTIISARSLEMDEQFRDVALDAELTYEEIFKTGLHRSNYNVLLSDYAYLQFRWENDHAWRLGYYPNPWLSGVASAKNLVARWEELETLGDLTYEETSDYIAEMPYQGAVPLIRFEYARAQYKEFSHPAAHFHIGRHTENRWPSSISIGPKAFSLIIAKLYYPEAWSKCSNFEGAGVSDCLEEQLLFILQDVRAVHEFSEKENLSFHFGKYSVQETPPAQGRHQSSRKINSRKGGPAATHPTRRTPR